MKRLLGRSTLGVALACVSGLAGAYPLSVLGDAGQRGEAVAVQLRDAATDAFVAATVLVDFDPLALRFLEPPQPASFIDPANVLYGEVELGRVLVSLGDLTAQPATGVSGALLQIDFEILASAPTGPTAVSFRCVPPVPDAGSPLPIDAVTEQTSAAQLERLCANDYLIPFLSANVNVLANGQVSLTGTAWLLSLGIALMPWARGRRYDHHKGERRSPIGLSVAYK